MSGAVVERWFETRVRASAGLLSAEAVAALRSLMLLAKALERRDLGDRAREAIRRLRS
jgi:hypothetical protein